ncbi:MAG: DinB family protein [Bryobacteraceae bacterium]|nr:DinB family protein [Bryobacteraceae bacterium]
MAIRDSLLPEFEQEMAGVRKTLERMPEDKLDWAPHPKSMTVARLCGHLAELPMWAYTTLDTEELDVMPEGQPPKAMMAESREQVLRMFDEFMAKARESLSKATDEQMMANWTLLGGGRKFFTLPRIAVLRGMVLNHAIHHRAQMGVYLRMNDIPVPSLYGPSADEGAMGASA